MKKLIRKLLLSMLMYCPIMSISFAAKFALAVEPQDELKDFDIIKIDKQLFRIEKININELYLNRDELRKINNFKLDIDQLRKFEKKFVGSAESRGGSIK